MKNILFFLRKFGYLLLFVIYMTAAAIPYTRTYHFQRKTIINSGAVIAGAYFSITGYVSSFFHLRGENTRLSEEADRLRAENLRLHNAYNTLTEVPFTSFPTATNDPVIAYNSVLAHVINNSIHSAHNYITLNKGRADGIRADMGVISESGIVGVVSAVSEHYSAVISVLNKKMKISCRLKHGEYFGSLSWDDVSEPKYAYLNDIPRHAVFAKGDTVITSGFSTIFPEGIIAGTVEEKDEGKQENDNFFRLKIKLATDFQGLYHVRVLVNENTEERKNLEQNNLK